MPRRAAPCRVATPARTAPRRVPPARRGFAEINEHFKSNQRFDFRNFDHVSSNDLGFGYIERYKKYRTRRLFSRYCYIIVKRSTLLRLTAMRTNMNGQTTSGLHGPRLNGRNNGRMKNGLHGARNIGAAWRYCGGKWRRCTRRWSYGSRSSSTKTMVSKTCV